MLSGKVAEHIRKAASMVDVYSSLASKEVSSPEELAASRTEMKLLKKGIISELVEARKRLMQLGGKVSP